MDWHGPARVTSNCHAFIITFSGETRINRGHGDTQPPAADRARHNPYRDYWGVTHKGSWRWRTTPTHIRNDTGHWTERKSGLGSVGGRGRGDGAYWTHSGWLPRPGCELGRARVPNSIYILIKTAPLASPTQPLTHPHPHPHHDTSNTRFSLCQSKHNKIYKCTECRWGREGLLRVRRPHFEIRA